MILIGKRVFHQSNTPTMIFGSLTCFFYAGVMTSVYALYSVQAAQTSLHHSILRHPAHAAAEHRRYHIMLVTALNYTAFITLLSVGRSQVSTSSSCCGESLSLLKQIPTQATYR
jgi:hypothetical protein